MNYKLFFLEERSQKMGMRSIYIWLLVTISFLPGCGLGPSMMRANQLNYNDAVQFNQHQELLLNIVRLRYTEGPEFLTTSSISTQFSIDLSASAEAQVGDDQEQRTNLLNFGGAVGYSERPTITITPRNEKEFTQQLISPVDLETIFLLVNYGWNIDRVLRLTSDGINGIRNDTVREGPLKNYEIHLRDFSQVVKDLQTLQWLGLVELSYEPEEIALSGPVSDEKVQLHDVLEANKDNYKLEYQGQTRTYILKKVSRSLVLRFSQDAFQRPEWRQIIKILNLASNVDAYRVLNAPGSQIKAREISKESNELILSTRSVLGTMAYLSQGVSVPDQHLENGMVSDNKSQSSIDNVISDLFQVRVQESKPEHFGIAVPYKGYWFYIAEDDISSKRTIGVLNSLVRLKIQAAGAQNIPVLTLPVGR